MLGLLSDAVPRDQFPNAQFELYQMSNFQQPMEEGISLFLYRIAANTSRRNLPPPTGSGRSLLHRDCLGANRSQTATTARLDHSHV